VVDSSDSSGVSRGSHGVGTGLVGWLKFPSGKGSGISTDYQSEPGTDGGLNQ
jgi:hypothetical protein